MPRVPPRDRPPGDPGDARVQLVQVHLAESFYDQEDYLAAAEVMQTMLKSLGESRSVQRTHHRLRLGRTTGSRGLVSALN